MTYVRILLAGLVLGAAQTALADDAYLRLRCDGEATGAVVSINGVKKGECPIDLVVPEGRVKVSARKVVDEFRFRTFETELFLAAGAMKRESVVLGGIQFTPEGQRREDERLAREKAEADARAAALAEQQRREAEAKARYGWTQDYLYTLKTTRIKWPDGRPESQMPFSLWTSHATYAPLFLPISTLFDLSSDKDVFAKKVADPVAFANPQAMVSRAVRAGEGGAVP